MNEKAIQNKLAAIFSANKENVSIPMIYIDMTDDWAAAAILDELMFWTLPKKGTGRTSLRVKKDDKLWLAVRRVDWWERKRLKEREADRGIEKLIELDLIEKNLWNYNGKPTMHLRLKMQNFIQLYTKALENSVKALELDEDDSLLSDIQDLYQMMNFPQNSEPENPNSPFRNLRNGDSNSRNGELLNSRNGEFINSPTTLTTADGAKTKIAPPPEWGVAWQLGAGVDKIHLPDEEALQNARLANAIEMFPQQHKAHATAFIQSTGIFPLQAEVPAWIKAFQDQERRTGLVSQDIIAACESMYSDNLTIKDPFSVMSVAGSIHASGAIKQAKQKTIVSVVPQWVKGIQL